MPFDGDPDHEPPRDEVIDYLHRYAIDLDLAVDLNSSVTKLADGDGRYAAELAGRTVLADQEHPSPRPARRPRMPMNTCTRRGEERGLVSAA